MVPLGSSRGLPDRKIARRVSQASTVCQATSLSVTAVLATSVPEAPVRRLLSRLKTALRSSATGRARAGTTAPKGLLHPHPARLAHLGQLLVRKTSVIAPRAPGAATVLPKDWFSLLPIALVGITARLLNQFRRFRRPASSVLWDRTALMDRKPTFCVLGDLMPTSRNLLFANSVLRGRTVRRVRSQESPAQLPTTVRLAASTQ